AKWRAVRTPAASLVRSGRSGSVRPSEGRSLIGCRKFGGGAGIQRPQALEENSGEDHSPLTRGFGDGAIGGGQLLVRPAAVKADVGFHASPSRIRLDPLPSRSTRI